MGIWDFTRTRNDHSAAQAVVGDNTLGVQNPKTSGDLTGSDSDSSMSLEEKNEKEIREHPNTITAFAQPGVQKAEAVALVWSRPALYTAYAW